MGLLINIDRRSKTPLFRQIVEQVILLVRSGALKPGDRLPATRIMARQLEVNRSTVCKAYEELWSSGYLQSRPGSYSTVRERVELASHKPIPEKGLIPWAERSSPGGKKVYRTAQKEKALSKGISEAGIINFIPLSPDSRLFPLDDFRKCMNTVLADQGKALLQYGSPLGYSPLREFIARRMNLHRISVSPSEIMITTGAQNAFELILKLLIQPGAGVALEAPTYSRAIDALRLSGAEMTEIPMTPEGMDLDVLELIIQRKSPVLIHTMPNFHNPSGITTGQSHREKLLRICEHHRIPLVEDGFEEEMKYFGRVVPPIKSMDRFGVVIYLGTFSKVLFPGLRIGWIAADKDCIRRLEPIQRALILSGNLVDQAALDRFCRQGFYDLHLKRIHRVYRKRMKAATAALAAHLDPEHIRWLEPSGGYTIWLELRNPAFSESELAAHLLEHGVMVLPGRSHFINPPSGLHFRLSIAHLDEPAIEEGIKRLGRGLNDIFHKR